MLTDHQHRAQEHKNTKDVGHGGSQEESSAHKRLKPWQDVHLGPRRKELKDSDQFGGAGPDQPRPPDGNHKECLRREVVESARRVCQERR